MEKKTSKIKLLLKSKKFLIPAGLVVIAGLYYAFSGNGDPVYVLDTVKTADVDQIVSVNGTVESNARIDLRFQKNGKISAINFKEGDSVTTGDILLSLENRTAQIEVSRTKAGVDMAKADLNLKYVGPSIQEIKVSEVAISEAETNLANAEQNLKDIKLSNAEKLRAAELSLQSYEGKLVNAQISYDNYLATGETTNIGAEQDLEQGYDDAKAAILDALDTVAASLTKADEILGEDNNTANDEFEELLGIRGTYNMSSLKSAYRSAKNDREDAQDTYNSIKSTWERTAVDSLLADTENNLLNTKSLLDDIYQLLEDTITGNSFTQTELDTLKSNISTKQSALTTELSSIQTIKQTIANAKLGITSTGLSADTSLNSAKSTLDDAKNNVEIYTAKLEQAKIENQIAENNGQMEIELASVRVQQAQANHNQLIAKPRSVDIAALQAKVDQAQAIHDQALKDLEDTQILAPVDGIVTQINGDIGENVSTTDTVCVLMTDALQIKANISETDITKIHPDNKVEITLDAFPLDVIFNGHVLSVNPAETVINGVIYYEAIILLDEPAEGDPLYEQYKQIKSGMTANLDILSAQAMGVLTIPPQALHYEGVETFVFVPGQAEGNGREKRIVKTGLEGEDLIEILSGLEEGQEIVLYEK